MQGVASVRPYIMDLGSVNGTWLNRERIEPERYLQLLEQASCCPCCGCVELPIAVSNCCSS